MFIRTRCTLMQFTSVMCGFKHTSVCTNLHSESIRKISVEMTACLCLSTYSSKYIGGVMLHPTFTATLTYRRNEQQRWKTDECVYIHWL